MSSVVLWFTGHILSLYLVKNKQKESSYIVSLFCYAIWGPNGMNVILGCTRELQTNKQGHNSY